MFLIYLFSFSGLSEHNRKLQRFEELFTKINHPPDTQKLDYKKYLGGNHTVGNGDSHEEMGTATIVSLKVWCSLENTGSGTLSPPRHHFGHFPYYVGAEEKEKTGWY